MTSTDTLLPCEHCGCRFGYHEAGCAALVDDIVSVAVTGFKTDVQRILSGKASTPPTPAAEEREAVARAYQAGAEAVHKAWVDTGGNCPGEPDFWEAAHDYADAHPFVAAEILAAEANERARIFADDLPTLYQARQIIADAGILTGNNGKVFTKLGALAMKIHHAIERNEHGAGK